MCKMGIFLFSFTLLGNVGKNLLWLNFKNSYWTAVQQFNFIDFHAKFNLDFSAYLHCMLHEISYIKLTFPF